ncbi:MAG: LPXTG cell wall anchor domain-containing protein, partial [Clostridia bacterium]|nr:LPXTG cell wall anchor domain-containing protein [Clostridia bacterium]MBQ5956488.1 LPXTG cell wall anchor domain-containing protein [Clostridia bacterium]MBR4623144.1 LPXTG cell wall anchor domain-containing protein [Clostridia bacterium]MBR6136319.1 LPXTG cell wall anchor domain-containing protein [Clostridia bacterium]MBR6823099.1 LPXTG cell wall anchor domain-containing protein [Clostridia bacterium]
SGFTVTNTHTEVPKTGDNSNLLFWIILLAVSAIAAGAIVVTMIRKRSKER